MPKFNSQDEKESGLLDNNGKRTMAI